MVVRNAHKNHLDISIKAAGCLIPSNLFLFIYFRSCPALSKGASIFLPQAGFAIASPV